MSGLRSFVVRFLGDSKDLEKTNRDVGDSANALGKRFEAVGEAAASFYVVDKVVQFGRTAVQVASDIEESTNKIGVLYGSAADDIFDASTRAAESAGLSERAYLDLAGTVGGLGMAAGKTGQDLADFGQSLIARAADVGSFNNAATADVVQAFGAALRGEMEPIRAFNVMLDDATLKQKALEMGLIETTKQALDPQTKSLAAYELIMEQTTVAVDDFANTSDGLANSQKTLGAQIENIQGTLGESLLPIVTSLVGVVGDAATAFGDLEPEVQSAVLQIALFGAGALALVKGITSAKAALTSFKAATALSATVLVAASAVVAGAALLYVGYAMKKAEARKQTEQFTAALEAEAEGQQGAIDALLARELADIADEAAAAGLSLSDLAKVIKGEQVDAYDAATEAGRRFTLNSSTGSRELDNFGRSSAITTKVVDELREAYRRGEQRVSDLTAAQRALGIETADVAVAAEEAKAASEAAAKAAEEQAKAEQNLADRIANVADEMNNRTDATMRAFSAELQLRGAVRSTSDALDELDEVQESVTAGTLTGAEAVDAMEEALDDAAGAALDQAGAAAKLAEEQAKANGETLTAQQRTKIMREELDKVAATLAPGSPLRRHLDEYRQALGWANEEARRSATASSGAFQAAGFGGAGTVGGVATGDPTSLAAARDRLASSTQSVADAQARLARMQELGEQDAAKLAAGEQAIEQAMISQAQATVGLERTQAELRGEVYTATQAAEAYNRVLSAGAETLAPNSPVRANLMGYIADVQSASAQLQALADAQARRDAETAAASEREAARRDESTRRDAAQRAEETARREQEARREAELSLFGLRRGRDQAAGGARDANAEVFNAAMRMLHGSGSVREYEDALERARDATVSLANQDARVAEAEARAAGQSFGAGDEARITAESLRRFATQLPDTDPLKALLLGDATSIASLGRVNVTIVQPARATWDQQDLRDYQDRQDILAVPTLRG